MEWAAVKVHYGKGKVAVTGFHPEAGFFWKLFEGKVDPDGTDFAMAIDMIRYATTP